MPQTATVKRRPAAFQMMKAMQAEGVEWGEDYRGGARQALVALLEGDQHLERMAARGPGRSPQRLRSPSAHRARRHRARGAAHADLQRAQGGARPRQRAKNVDRMILAWFALGLSTRKVVTALLPLLGRPVSPATVSAMARQLDAAVAAFHRRPPRNSYRVLVLDGVVLKRKTGAGALARPVLVALGLRPDGKKEAIVFRLAGAESVAPSPAARAPAALGPGPSRSPRNPGPRPDTWPAPRPNEPCVADLWHGGGAPTPCTGWARGRRSERAQGL